MLETILKNNRLCDHYTDMLKGLKGRFQIEHYGPANHEGCRDLLGIQKIPNGIVNVGKDYILNVMFNSASQITTWYGGIIDNASFSALAAADTMSSHAGWIESVAYSQSTRVAWGSGTSTTQSTTNASAMTFDITGTATLNGIFITSGSAKSGTAGTLWTTASFSSTVPVSNGDQIKATYTVSC